MNEAGAASFTGLVDLAAASLGGRAIGTSDDFFAEMGNLLLPGRGVFIEGKFTDRGKWMDGWESRRKRESGHDWCVIELGAPGTVLGLDVDTNHFVGNCPSFAAVEGILAPRGTALADLQGMKWTEVLPPSALRPGSQNLFAAAGAGAISHVRLSIFPDGGVARFRVFGRVQPRWDTNADAPASDRDDETRAHVPANLVDLGAVKNGGLALACSDAFFGPMNNLLLPGRAENMGGGWETRRKRAPGHDWILVQLGARGAVEAVEVDTNHFKGNHPDRFSLDVIDAPGARVTDLVGASAYADPQGPAKGRWRPLLPETGLGPSARHFFRETLSTAPATHARLNVFPDGGVSRLRLWGTRA